MAAIIRQRVSAQILAAKLLGDVEKVRLLDRFLRVRFRGRHSADAVRKIRNEGILRGGIFTLSGA